MTIQGLGMFCLADAATAQRKENGAAAAAVHVQEKRTQGTAAQGSLMELIETVTTFFQDRANVKA